MKKHYFITIISVLLYFCNAAAQTRETASDTCDFRTRFSVSAEKCLIKDKLYIGLEEEVRLDAASSRFDRLYSTLSLEYKPLQWLKIAPEYSLINLLDRKKNRSSVWEIKHRAALNLTGTVKTGRWQFSLRERPQVLVRTDSINVCEKTKASFVLRSKVQAMYSFFHIPLKLYVFVEMTNTLNTPDRFEGLTGKGSSVISYKLKNHISKMRYSLGAEYRFDKRNRIELSYRLDDGTDYDIHITKNKGYLTDITKRPYINHIICAAYKFSF